MTPCDPHSKNGPVTELNRPEFLGDFPVLFHAAANAACSGSGLIPTSGSWRSGKRGRSLIRFRRTPQRSPLLAVVVEHGECDILAGYEVEQLARARSKPVGVLIRPRLTVD